MRTATEPVPLVDLAFQHAEVNAEIAEAVIAAMTNGWRVEGGAASQFEAAFAAFCQRRHCVGVANGTDTILLMLRAAGIGSGDEVIVPANGRLAMVAAVLRAGARPVLADCDPQYHLLDPDRLRAHLTLRTRAVVAVHLYGQMAPVEDLAAVAGDRIVLFEDAAQSPGATRHGRTPGTWSRAVVTSFHPRMNLGAYGRGAAVLTDDDVLADRLRSLRPSGHRLDDGQAIVLLAKLRHLPDWNARRAVTARLYRALLEDDDRIVLPATMPGNEHVWHLYVVRVADRDAVLAALQSAGIGAAVHYPVPIHLMPPCDGLGYRRGDFPHAEAAAAEILSLPIYPGIHADDVERVADALRRAVRG
jgi:dTDP-4-amino-4,6-dideoxygalactose transaminase